MTSPERWRRIQALYHEAWDRDPAERATFLAEACEGDEEMRRDVESLLARSDSSDRFISELADRGALLTLLSAHFTGTVVDGPR